MYNWLFFKVYDYYRSKNNDDPVFNSSTLVFIAQGVHVILLLLVLSKFIDFSSIWGSSDKSISKFFYIPIFCIWLVLVYRYYRNKAKLTRPLEVQAPLSLYKLIVIIFVIIIIPIYFIIKLSGGEVWKFD